MDPTTGWQKLSRKNYDWCCGQKLGSERALSVGKEEGRQHRQQYRAWGGLQNPPDLENRGWGNRSSRELVLKENSKRHRSFEPFHIHTHKQNEVSVLVSPNDNLIKNGNVLLQWPDGVKMAS